MMAQHADAFVGIRVPEPIKKKWLEQAKHERRSLSNWILHQMMAEETPSSKRPAHSKKTMVS